MDKFYEFQKAIESGDEIAIDRARRRLFLSDRDEFLDREFIDSVKGKTLGKNIARILSDSNNFDVIDYAKIVSSMITHCFIEAQVKGNPISDYPIKELYVILGGFINSGSDEQTAISACKDFVADRFGSIL